MDTNSETRTERDRLDMDVLVHDHDGPEDAGDFEQFLTDAFSMYADVDVSAAVAGDTADGDSSLDYDDVYRRLVSETDISERAIMVSPSEGGVAYVYAAPDVSGVLSALRDLGYASIGVAGGDEFPTEFHIKEGL